MKTKIYSMFLAVCLLLGISGCGLSNPSTSKTNSENVTTVKMIKADIMQDSAQERQLRSVKRLNSSTVNSEETTTEENEDLENENSGETQEPETSVESTEPTPSEPIVDGPQYVIIYKSETDITLTITLDNPEAHGIDALRVTCDDPEAKIQVEGEWKPIAQEADGTRVVNWSSEDPYEKTYNIRTTSLEDLYTFKVVDIRLAGHDKFLSKQTKSTDFGNNKLDIYKMDNDAYELDVISNTFEEIKFGIKVKDGIENLSNFKVDGELPNEEGYWVMNESKKVAISYDFELENGSKIRRDDAKEISILKITAYDRYNDYNEETGCYTTLNVYERLVGYLAPGNHLYIPIYLEMGNMDISIPSITHDGNAIDYLIFKNEKYLDIHTFNLNNNLHENMDDIDEGIFLLNEFYKHFIIKIYEKEYMIIVSKIRENSSVLSFEFLEVNNGTIKSNIN